MKSIYFLLRLESKNTKLRPINYMPTVNQGEWTELAM